MFFPGRHLTLYFTTLFFVVGLTALVLDSFLCVNLSTYLLSICKDFPNMLE